MNMDNLASMADEQIEKMLDNGYETRDAALVGSHLHQFLINLKHKMADSGTVFYQP